MSADVVEYLPDGTPIRLGYVNPEEMRFAAVPAFDEANPVLPREQWREHDDYASSSLRIIAQQNNNCTNASLAGLLEDLKLASGEENVEPLSVTFQYALHNGGRDAGAMCRDLVADIREGKHGLPREVVFPPSQIYVPRGGMSAAVLEDAKKTIALEVYQCMTFADVCSALSRDFMVYFGLCLGERFINGTPADGKVPEWSGHRTKGHAMFARGLTKRFGDWRPIVKNSWGSRWGFNGICYMPESYFWAQSGNYINLDAYAIRAIKRVEQLPRAS